jgi:tripartite-type tricarboxylate transporter receptor subunit TctC
MVDNATRAAINAVVTQARVDELNAANSTNISLAVVRAIIHYFYDDVEPIADAVKESRRMLVDGYLNFKNIRANTLAQFPQANVIGLTNAITALETEYPFLANL